MRNCQRNQIDVWYRLYNPSPSPEAIVDEYGNETGEYGVPYFDPVKCRMNVSPARGATQIAQFGELSNYDRVLVTADMDCPIDEYSILYIDETPVKDLNTDEWSPANYTVWRVAKSLNQIAIAVRKVDVANAAPI